MFSKEIIRGRLLKLKKTRQISKQLTEGMLNDVTVKWKLGRRRRENDPRCV